MSTIATLQVMLAANTAAFSSGMKKAGGLLAGLSPILDSVASRLAALGLAFNARDAIVSLFEFANAGMQIVDSQNDLANRLGTTTKFLATVKYASKLAGDQFEDMSGALQKLNRTLGEAEIGSVKANAAFDKLGLDGARLAKMPLADAFKEIAEAISQLGTPAQRAAAAVSLFGKGGQSILNTLSEGAPGIERSAKAAEMFGLSLSDIDTKAIAAANDEWDRAGLAIEGAQIRLGLLMAPLKQEFGYRIQAAGVALQWLTGNLAYATEDAKELVKPVEAVSEAMIEASESGQKIIEHLQEQVDGFGKAAHHMAVIKAFNEGIRGDELAKIEALATQLDLLEEQKQMQSDATREAERTRRETEQAEKQRIAEIAMEAKRQAEDLQRSADAVRAGVATPMEKFAAEIADLQRLLGVGAINWETYERAVAKAVGELSAIDEQTGAGGAILAGSAESIAAKAGNANREQQEAKRLQVLEQIRDTLRRNEAGPDLIVEVR